ncbi:uncharacterized protein LOC126979618 isoform X2 [Leptidea sinapis]|uniref:uncharacterized protein LOC126979618 isoform X2 n=1 Tax=Leptidea sinapis TaxID=189913 RepID=UPI0021C4973C|nr:uncharacterized protein LOC126979618 isoform X2 [Leptidea sinapis]
MLPFVISTTKLLQIKKRQDKTNHKNKIEPSIVLHDPAKCRNRKPLKILPPFSTSCECSLKHVTHIVVNYAPKSRKRGVSNIVLSMTWEENGQKKRIKLPNLKLPSKKPKKNKLAKDSRNYENDEFFLKLENQLKALNIGKTLKIKKSDIPTSQRSKNDKETNDKADSIAPIDDEGGEIRRRGKRRRKGRGGGSDRLTSAGLAAQAQQDPETQVAGIGTDSHNSSSRPSLAAPSDDVIVLPLVKTAFSKKTDSFLDDDILKFLHREVDEEAIETEFDVKRRYVLEEALRTRPDRALSQEMHALLRELRSPAVCLGDWLHVPRVFSRKNSQFGLPTDSNDLEKLTAMQYASRFVTLKKSKQLLYLTVLRKFRPNSYRMPKKDIQEGLILMMGGIMTHEQATQYESIMEWQHYLDEDFSDEIKLHMLDTYRKQNAEGDTGESVINTIKYRTWCGLCAICERMYGRFPPRDKDPPEGIELSDFTMIETKLSALNVHRGLLEILNTIRSR